MKRILIKFGLLFIFFVLLLILSNLNFFKVWEKQTIDLRFHLRGEIAPYKDIVIVGIDDNSILELGNWPWNRSIHGKLLDVLKRESPKLVVFDILFDTVTPSDVFLAEKVKLSGNVILSGYLQSYFDKRLKINVMSLKEPVGILKSSALGSGYSNLYIDEDNKVRRVKIYENSGSIKYYSLSLVAYKFISKQDLSSLVLKLPSDFYINFRGGEGTYKIYSYIDVLRGNFPKNTFKNKIVLIGAVSPVLKDLFLHPFSGFTSRLGVNYSYMSGVEIHANIIDNLFMHDFFVPIFPGFVFIINFLAVFLPGVLFGRRIILNLFLTFLFIFLYFMFSYQAFINKVLLPLVSPSVGLIFSFLGNVIYLNLIPKERLEGVVIKRRYKILKKLGSGGMASVYLALDRKTEKEVAIKILHPQYAEDKEVLERFYREIEICKVLDHPYIVKILDHGKENDYVFMVMEFVNGKDLKKIIEESKRIPVSMAVEIVKKVAEALSYANSKNIVHRDIKPQNIMITKDGKVKLMDFGIARIGGLSTLTQTGMFMGTPQYASPEQLEGKKVDVRSDIFSLGIVFYEMLTGILPYSEETTISLMLKRYQEDLPDVRTINPEVPEGIAKIIEKMTARFPEFRYQTLEELLEDLKRGYPLHPYDRKNILSSDTIIKRDNDKESY
ncbi:MAG: protein kinase [Dictyoglomus turgidum]|nr:MAG: protein kinase [Dictyoglomus turgidum]